MENGGQGHRKRWAKAVTEPAVDTFANERNRGKPRVNTDGVFATPRGFLDLP
jgi:hypothetical protein